MIVKLIDLNTLEIYTLFHFLFVSLPMHSSYITVNNTGDNHPFQRNNFQTTNTLTRLLEQLSGNSLLNIFLGNMSQCFTISEIIERADSLFEQLIISNI